MTQSTPPGIISTAIDLFNQIIGRRRTPSDTLPTVDSTAFQRYADHFDQEASDNLDRLANKQITIDEWEAAMEESINSLHMTAEAIGVGGIDNLTQDNLNDVLAITDIQNSYLHAWADQLRADIADGKDINYEGLKARAKMYRNAADATLQKATLSHVGIPDLPAVPRDGSSQCLGNCDCKLRIERLSGQGNFDVYWELGTVENHCENCPQRAQVWNPLKIRNGEIEPYPVVGLFADH